MNTLNQLNRRQMLQRAGMGIGSLGFKHPTPVQGEAIPHALEGRDLLACAATGSGKTAAFLLPMLHRFINEPRGMTKGLVLAPTRELALQIVDDFSGLARFTKTADDLFTCSAREKTAGAVENKFTCVVLITWRSILLTTSKFKDIKHSWIAGIQ